MLNVIKRGQPFGSAHIDERSEQQATLKCGIPSSSKHQIPRKEAEIVAQAGRLGAVTIATNMAGRGTDILLGGNLTFDQEELRRQGKIK